MVAADSHLCEDVYILLSNEACKNIRGEVCIPGVFDNFGGYDGMAETTKTCEPFAITFGSELDLAASQFLDEYKLYMKKREQAILIKSYNFIFPVITQFMQQLLLLTTALKWNQVQSFSDKIHKSLDG